MHVGDDITSAIEGLTRRLHAYRVFERFKRGELDMPPLIEIKGLAKLLVGILQFNAMTAASSIAAIIRVVDDDLHSMSPLSLQSLTRTSPWHDFGAHQHPNTLPAISDKASRRSGLIRR